MTFFYTILDIIFPVNCLNCNKKGVQLCLNCIMQFPSAERETTDWIFPLYDYRCPQIKKAIWLLKYKGKRGLAEIFAECMYSKITEELSEFSIFENFREPILIPIPLSKKRLQERGFNQTELICKQILKLDTEKIFTLEKNVLIKTKETEHQARIKNRNERLKNLTNTFGIINPEKIKSRNIILIDDVTTTGATLNEARKILKKSGAKKIIAFTVAH